VPVVIYSLLRLGLLAAAVGALWLVGLRDWLLVLVAIVVALLLSYALLRPQRDAAARWLAERAERRREPSRFAAGVAQDAAEEDAEADRLRGEDAGPPREG
jgi:membrane protein implicated in regulation of membrane protease activity